MKKLIRYFDPNAKDPGYPGGREIEIIAGTDEEYAAHMEAINDLSRGIANITVEDIAGDISNLGIDAGQIREWRDEEFKLIDKYQLTLVYVSLDSGRQSELAAYRKMWLNAPEKMFIPKRPEWMV